MKVGVRARVILYAINTEGRQQAYHPGEVVYVGKQIAKQWVAEHRAELLPPPPDCDDMAFSCGVMVRTVDVESAQVALAGAYPQLSVTQGSGLNFSKTLLLDGQLSPRSVIVGLGFNLLKAWQVVAPLWSYTELARHVGSEKERTLTQAIIRDLRVPLYDTRMVFMRRCSTTLALLDCWRDEMVEGGEERLAFLRAIYQVKPTVCAGPTTWLGMRDV